MVSHTHTAAVGSSPNHDHTVPAAVQQSFFAGNLANLRFNAQGGGAARGVDGGNSQHSHSALNANNAGESGTDKNLPPYYALAYIMYGGV